MPWIPIDRLPEEAKDGREVLVWDSAYRNMEVITKFDSDGGAWLGDWDHLVSASHFYDFGEGRTMPDAPEGE